MYLVAQYLQGYDILLCIRYWRICIPMCQYHSTRPQSIQLVLTTQKSSLCHHFRRNSWKLGSQKLHVHAHFWCTCKFSFCPNLNHSQGHIWAKMCHYVTKWPKTDPYRPKMAKRVVLPHFCERVVLPHFRERVDESPRQDENFGTFGLFLSFFVSEIWPFKVEIPVRAIFSLYF